MLSKDKTFDCIRCENCEYCIGLTDVINAKNIYVIYDVFIPVINTISQIKLWRTMNFIYKYAETQQDVVRLIAKIDKTRFDPIYVFDSPEECEKHQLIYMNTDRTDKDSFIKLGNVAAQKKIINNKESRYIRFLYGEYNKHGVYYHRSEKHIGDGIADLSGNVNCINCINCSNCINCVNCVDCEYCKKCKKCSNCVGCEECNNLINAHNRISLYNYESDLSSEFAWYTTEHKSKFYDDIMVDNDQIYKKKKHFGDDVFPLEIFDKLFRYLGQNNFTLKNMLFKKQTNLIYKYFETCSNYAIFYNNYEQTNRNLHGNQTTIINLNNITDNVLLFIVNSVEKCEKYFDEKYIDCVEGYHFKFNDEILLYDEIANIFVEWGVAKQKEDVYNQCSITKMVDDYINPEELLIKYIIYCIENNFDITEYKIHDVKPVTYSIDHIQYMYDLYKLHNILNNIDVETIGRSDYDIKKDKLNKIIEITEPSKLINLFKIFELDIHELDIVDHNESKNPDIDLKKTIILNKLIELVEMAKSPEVVRVYNATIKYNFDEIFKIPHIELFEIPEITDFKTTYDNITSHIGDREITRKELIDLVV